MIKIWLHELYMERFKISYILNINWQPYIQGKKIKNREKMILLMSLYQLIFLDKVPDYAVIDEAVRLAKKRDNFAGKFVNAILRNFLRNGKCEIDEEG